MNAGLIPLVFGLILLAELPDKSMFASLVLGTRFRASWVFAGVMSAFVVHVVIAVTAGSLISLLPRKPVDIAVTLMFLAGAALLWRTAAADHGVDGAEENATDRSLITPRGEPGFPAVFLTSFGVIFVGEWGDITQLLTANLAARYSDPIAVGLGAGLGLGAAALLAITAGRRLLRHVSSRVLQRIGAVVLLCLGVLAGVQLARG
jgi:putative Ca2+/H+ antiporter (TMEM165/GDT1 family)